jgi:hypothetical protein
MTDFIKKDRELLSGPPNRTDIFPAAISRDSTPQGNNTFVTRPPVETRSTVASAGSATAAAVVRSPEEEKVALFTPNETADLRARWDSIQVGFVDEPRKTVEEADELVSATMKRLAEIFSDERQKLEQHWDRNEDISTEDFRIALRRYRSFFSRLLAV